MTIPYPFVSGILERCPYCGHLFTVRMMELHRPACHLALAERENRRTSAVPVLPNCLGSNVERKAVMP